MYNKIYRSKIILATSIIILPFGILSCKKFVDIKPSPNLVQTDQLFINDATALSAVNGVYLQMRASSPSLANGTLSIYAGLGADELTASATSLEYDAFNKNSILSISTIVNSQIWSTAYKVIYRTNAIIENLEKSTEISQSTRSQLMGEMKVVKSLYYFYLINLFGDVPLITSSDYKENEYKPRTAINEVYQQIVADLTNAISLLSESYSSPGKVRPNKWTATALLARVYLFKGDWINAEAQSSSVISSDAYAMVADLNEVFKINSDETIWEIAPANESRNTVEGSVFVPSSSSNVPIIYLTPLLVSSFEIGDARKSSWLGLNAVAGNMYYYPFKYKQRTATPVDEYEIVFRLAEQYLIRAEARIKQNKFAEASVDLNVVRNRAGLPNTTANDQNSLLYAIIKERQIELLAEWGNRWFDLKRNGSINSVLAPMKGSNWQTTDTLYPIPFDEIQINTYLVQNPGY